MSWLWNALDYVPVVGTVKNGTEAIVCLADGDIKGAASKSIQTFVGGTLDYLTFGIGSGAISKLAFSETAKQSGKVVAKTFAVKVAEKAAGNAGVNIGARMLCSTVSNPPVGDVYHDGVGGRRMAYFRLSEIWGSLPWNRQPDNSQIQRPARRGEHVINNNVLRVYRDIINEFACDVTGMNIQSLVDTDILNPDSRIVQAYSQPLTDEFMDLIRNRMVVHVDEDYLDSNSINYGRQIEILRGSVGMYLGSIYENLTSRGRHESNSVGISSWEREIRTRVEDFIAGNYFVDEHALKLWLRQRGNSRDIYERGHSEVVKMFRRLIYDGNNDDLIQWVKELVDAKKRLDKYKYI